MKKVLLLLSLISLFAYGCNRNEAGQQTETDVESQRMEEVSPAPANQGMQQDGAQAEGMGGDQPTTTTQPMNNQ